MRSDVDLQSPVHIFIKGRHIPENMLGNHQPSIARINLSHKTRDLVLASRRGASASKTGVIMRMLAQYNEASVDTIREELKSQKNICAEQKLQSLLERDRRRIKGQDGPWTMLHKLIVK